MSSMWNPLNEKALQDRVSSLESSRTADESAITTLQAAVKALTPTPLTPLILNRDLSTGDLSQYTHADNGGSGLILFHPSVAGRRAVGLTATGNSLGAGSPGNSNSVLLWDPAQPWGYSGQEWWLRTSFFFPSSAALLSGEAPYIPTEGEWNWFLVLHKDILSGPSNLQFGVLTDYTASPGPNPRLFMRLNYGNEASPTALTIQGQPLLFDHWYEMLVHVKLDPVAGIVEWFLDGQLMYSNLNIPTLFVRSTGIPSIDNLTVCNYRTAAAWNSTLFIGPLCIAKDKASALAAF